MFTQYGHQRIIRFVMKVQIFSNFTRTPQIMNPTYKYQIKNKLVNMKILVTSFMGHIDLQNEDNNA